MAGLFLAWVMAEAQTYSPPHTYYSSPPPTQTPPTASLSKKQPPVSPPAKKYTPPPPPSKKNTPPPKKNTPPPPPPPSKKPSTPTWPSPPPPPTNVPTPPSTTPIWPSSPPPPSSTVEAKKVRCKNKAYSTCYFRQFTCPADCPNSCDVDCHTCSPVCDCNKPGAVCQEPRFIGADGLTFYFHGKKDRNFCLVSDPNLHINAHFIGKRNPTMGRDFTWVQSLGILFDNHYIYIGARKTAMWNDAIDRLTLSFDRPQRD
ncbi:hypothetical protein RND81_01G060800 [Saponaria officinalis]|uniref:Uncharacterized protein n=1 Tax=Saponaria officinalis TaxID=3572 RepID=A0AAW1NEK9_SAPOF